MIDESRKSVRFDPKTTGGLKGCTFSICFVYTKLKSAIYEHVMTAIAWKMRSNKINNLY